MSDFVNNNADEIASIYVEACLDLRKLNQELMDLQSKKYNISVGTDEKALTGLNQHLDLKVKHLNQVISHFDRNVIRPRVDDRALTNLNRQLDLLSVKRVSFTFDDRAIASELSNIRKQLQGVNLKVSLDSSNIQRSIEDSIGKAFASTKLQTTLALQDNRQNRDVVIGLRNVENAVKRNQKGVFGNVLTGFGEGFGNLISKELNKRLKKDLGINIPGQATVITKSIKQAKNFFIDDNEIFQAYLNKKQQQANKSITSFVRKFGDSLADALDIEGDSKARLEVLKTKLVENLGIKDLQGTLESTLKGFDVSKPLDIVNNPEIQKAHKQLVKDFNAFRNALLNPQLAGKILSPVDEGIRNYRKGVLKDVAIPLVQERLAEIQAGKRKSGQQTGYIKDIKEDDKELFLTIGGYAGARGLSGKRIAKAIREQSIPGVITNAITGTDTDIAEDAVKSGKTFDASLRSQAKPLVRGYSKDAIEIAAQAIAAIQKNPNLKVKVLGESGGGFAASEAYHILKEMGYGKSIDYLGVGTPDLIGGLDPNTEKRLLSPDEYLGVATRKLYNPLGIARVNTRQQNLLGMQGHTYEFYQKTPEFQKFLFGDSEIDSDKIKRIKRYEKNVSKERKSNFEDEDELNLFVDNLEKEKNEIEYMMVSSTGQTRKRLESLAKVYHKIWLRFQPETSEMSDYRLQIEGVENEIEKLKKDSKPENYPKIAELKRKLVDIQDKLENDFDDAIGTVAAKKESLLDDIQNNLKSLDSKRLVTVKKEVSPRLSARQALLAKLQAESAARQSETLKEIQPVIETNQPILEIPKNTQPVKQIISAEDAKNNVKNIAKVYNAFYAESKNIIQSSMELGDNQKAIEEFKKLTNAATQAKKEIKAIRDELKSVNLLDSDTARVIDLEGSGQISKIEKKIKQQLAKAGIKPDSIKTGENIAEGLAIGLEKGNADVEEAAVELAHIPLKIVKKELDIHSPSGLFIQLGEFVAQGFEIGINFLDRNKVLEPFKNAKTELNKLMGDDDGFGGSLKATRETLAVPETIKVKIKNDDGFGGDIEATKKAVSPVDEGTDGFGGDIEATKKATRNIPEIKEKLSKTLGKGLGEVLEKVLTFVGTENVYGQLLKGASFAIKSFASEGFGFLSGLLDSNNKKLTGLIGNVSKLGLAFAAFKFILPLWSKFAEQSLKVAVNFESIYSQIKFTSGAVSQGTKNVDTLNQQARDLRLDREGVLSGSSGFLAATEGTTLEGSQSTEMLKNFNVFMRTRNVDRIKQKLALIAVSQMASKGTIQSEELKGQLAEALPGSYQIFARSQGLTVNQLGNKLKRGELGSESLLKFSQQAYAENIANIPESLDTVQASTQRLDNAMIDLQENIGKAFLPLEKAKLNLFASTLELVNNNSRGLIKAFQFLGVLLTKPLWMPFITGALSAVNVLKGMSINMAFLGNTLKTFDYQMFNIGKQFAVFYAAGEIIRVFGEQFKDLTGDFGQQVKQQIRLIEEYKKLKNPEQGKQIERTNDLTNIGKRIIGLNGIFGENTDKIVTDKNERVRESKANTKFLLDEAGSSEINSSIASINKIDKALADNQARQRAFLQLNPQDKDGFRSLKTEEKQIIDSRAEALKNPGALQANVNSQIEVIKNQIDYLETLKGNENLYSGDVERINKEIIDSKTQLVDLEKTQDALTKAIGKSADAFGLFKKQIELTGVELEDNKVKIEFTANLSKKSLFDAVAKGTINPGNQQLLNSTLDIRTQQQQYKANLDAVSQQKALLSSEEAQRILKSYKVDENTGSNKLKYLADNAENANDKFILQQFAEYKNAKNNLTAQAVGISQAKADLVNSLKEQTKQVAEYYQGIVRQVKESKLEFQKQLNQLNTIQAQNKIKAALTDVGDNIFTQFADSLIQNLQELNDIKQSKLDSQSKIQGLDFQIEDARKQAFELKRSLPGNDQGLNSGDAIKREAYKIVESVGNRNEDVHDFEDLAKHHPSSGKEAGRQYANINGKLEEIRTTEDGRTLIKKDFVLMGKQGNQNVVIPSPSAGYAKTGDYGSVSIYQDAQLTKLVAKVLHMSNIKVKDGDFIKYGQDLGIQDGIGKGGKRSYAIHAHVEAERERFKEYIADLKDGIFDFNGKAITNPENSNQPNGARLSNNVVTGSNEGIFNQAGMSGTLISLIKEKEGFHKKAYWDYGQHSVGFGTRAKSANETIGVEEANERLLNELQKARNEVQKLVKVKLSGNQLDALTSFQYNTGGLQGSTLLKKLNSGDVQGAANEFQRWVKADGQTLPGLVKRRDQERDLFMNPAISAYMQGKFINPNTMQGLINHGSNMQIGNLEQQKVITGQLNNDEIEGKKLDIERKNNQALRTFQRGTRDLEGKGIQSSRELEDARNNIVEFKTPDQQYTTKLLQGYRDYEDKIRNRKIELIEIDKSIDDATKVLSTGLLDPTQKSEVEKALQQSQGLKAQYEKEIEEFTKLKDKSFKEITTNFNTQEGFRIQGIEFEQAGQQLNTARAKVENMKALRAFTPLAQQDNQVITLEKENSLKEAQLELDRQILDIKQKMFRKELTDEEGKKQIENLQAANEERKKTIELTAKQQELQLAVTNIENHNTLEKTKTDFLTSKKFTKQDKQIELMRSRGMNEFTINAFGRKNGREQEEIRYQEELRNFEAEQARMKLQGIDIDPEALDKVRKDMEAIHNLNLEGINNQFKTFGKTLDDIARTSVQGLSQGFTDLIMGTKSLNDVLDQFFNNILSSVLNTAFSSLLGGLTGGGMFGGKGGLLGGIFYDGGIVPNYAKGGIHKALNKERSESGRNPMLVVAHEGEMMIPAWRMQELSQLGLGEKELLGYADGGVIGNMRSPAPNRANSGLEVKYDATVINNQSYVTAEQFEQGIKQAAQAGAEGGLQRMQNKLANSSSFRRSVGI